MTKDIESILVSEVQIDEITTRIAEAINNDYKNSDKKLVLISKIQNNHQRKILI